MASTDHTHDPRATSWVPGAQAGASDFPLQNLPHAVFRPRGASAWRGGVAIGERVLDLDHLSATGLVDGLAAQALALAAQGSLNAYLEQGPLAWRALRHALFDLLGTPTGDSRRERVAACLVPMNEVEYRLPTRLGNYTDFYTSIHHARNVGRVRRPDRPLSANFQWLPIAYHGRASSVVISGTPFRRPMGQALAAGEERPIFGACRRLDYELELGFYVGPGNRLGEPVALADAEDHIFGVCLLNDWSARDHQFWEMDPLGPFLGKNFCTSVSPWVVTLDALAPFRCEHQRPAGDPQPLAYLDHPVVRAQGAFDIQLEVRLETPDHPGPGSRLSHTSFRHQYWTLAQMLAQHTVGGCNLQPGDLIGTGTISGPSPDEAGALVELSEGGTRPAALAQGGQRSFLQDGDTVVLRGWCESAGAVRIGFGECRGTVLPALGH